MAVLAAAEAPASPILQRARGEGRVIASARDGKTEIQSLYQDGCAKVRLPHTHSDALQAVPSERMEGPSNCRVNFQR